MGDLTFDYGTTGGVVEFYDYSGPVHINPPGLGSVTIDYAYPPGAKTALRGAVDLINATWKLGMVSVNSYEEKLAAIQTDWLDEAKTPTVSAGEVTESIITEPGVNIPANASTEDVMDLFDSKYMELVELLSARFVDFRNEYFPDEQNAYTAAEDWLQAAMANELGLPANVVAAMVQEDDARILAETARASDAVLATFAARRFPLPPGAAASAVLQLQQGAQKQRSETSRKIILASVEQLRWCVGQVLTLRKMSMDAAIEYIKALASGPDLASRLINVGYDAQSKLISAAAQFYNARTNAAELISKTRQFNVTTGLEVASKNQAAEIAMIEAKLKALLAECQVLSQVATSLFNNLRAGATMSYGMSGQDITQVTWTGNPV
jgi:hypothetical protein